MTCHRPRLLLPSPLQQQQPLPRLNPVGLADATAERNLQCQPFYCLPSQSAHRPGLALQALLELSFYALAQLRGACPQNMHRWQR